MSKQIYRFMVGFFLGVVLLAFFPSTASATVTLEQQINLINTTYSTTTPTTTLPNNNDLGFINWDTNQYSGATVYFEAIIRCTNCQGGNTRATAGLYNPSGTLVTDATVNTLNDTFTKLRSSAITGNLTDDQNYTVRITLDAESGTAEIKGARLIIIQSGDDITATQSQVDLASSSVSINTTYELVTYPKLFHYDAESYAPTPSIYFEATLQSTGGSGTAYAMLSSTSNCLSPVSGSEISSTDGGYARVRSGAISLSDNTVYYACIKTSETGTTSLADAKLILNQSNSLGISVTEASYQLVNTSVTDNDTTYTLQSLPIQYTPANYAGAQFDYYFETTQKTNTDTSYSSLYNISDGAVINNTELTTSATDYTRLRSPEIYGSLPTSTKNLDTQLKNSASGTTTVTSSRLIVIYSVYPELTFTVEGVANNTVTNGITTTGVSGATKLEFGNLVPSEVKYLAHKLTARTTAASGYSVTTKLLYTLQGNYPANLIEEFPYTWEGPHIWYTPDGTTPNVNTGWIGANTSDVRVPNWNDASAKFGPLGTTSRKVMESTGIDSGTSAYVTYALEINSHQPTDTYIGTLVYNITATY